MGFEVVDDLAARAGDSWRRHKRARAQSVETRVAGERAVLVKPLTFMNESGSAVAPLADFYRVDLAHTVVVHDDLDLPLGSLRIKSGGGDGGHNGLRSLRASLGSGDFLRVRVGIGRPPGRMDAASYVLRRFAKAELAEVTLIVPQAADAVEMLVTDGLAPTQNTFNN